MEVVELTQEQESEERVQDGLEIVEIREHFTEGQLVEVPTCCDDLELGGSWFTAKIIKLPNKEADSIFVEYENGSSDLPISAYVNASSLIRPVQLQDPPSQFLLNQVVDAFYGSGWWQGKIIEVHDDSRYTVCFPNSKRPNMDVGWENLRVHQDWVHRKWVCPQDEDKDTKFDQVDVRKSDPAKEDEVCDSSIMQVQSCSEDLSVQSLPFCIGSDYIPPSDQQQCHRTTKTWCCLKMALPGKIYCDKHQLLRDRYDDKRRKGPKEGSRFKTDLVLPCGERQCRRGGKRWRCHEMAAPEKVYCDKHQLKRDIYNDKRRKGPHKRRHLIMEPLSLGQEQSETENCCLGASGSDQSRSLDGDHSTGLLTIRAIDEARRIEDNNHFGGELLNSRGVESGEVIKRRRSQRKLTGNVALSSEVVPKSVRRKRKVSSLNDIEEGFCTRSSLNPSPA